MWRKGIGKETEEDADDFVHFYSFATFSLGVFLPFSPPFFSFFFLFVLENVLMSYTGLWEGESLILYLFPL